MPIALLAPTTWAHHPGRGLPKRNECGGSSRVKIVVFPTWLSAQIYFIEKVNYIIAKDLGNPNQVNKGLYFDRISTLNYVDLDF